MKRTTIVGPLLLILVGAFFLIRNIRPDLPLFEMAAQYWPVVLVAWGGLRLLEIGAMSVKGQPLPRFGMSGGEWFVIIFLTLAGNAVWGVRRVIDRFPAGIRIDGMQVFHETFDYPVSGTQKAGKTPRVVLDNIRGAARIVGKDAEEVTVSGRKTVRAMDKSAAEQANTQSPFEITTAGDIITIRTNLDRISNDNNGSADLEIGVPKGASIETRGRSSDVDIADVAGEISINSDRGGVRLQNLAGKVRIDIRRGDIVRGIDLKNDIEIKGGGEDIELENVLGQVSISGSRTGETVLRNVAKPVRFESSITDFRVERVPGQVSIQRGQLNVENAIGPLRLTTQSKDIHLAEVNGPVDVELRSQGDFELRQVKTPLSKVDVRLTNGNIEVEVPAAARFTLTASTERGSINNEFGGKFAQEDAGRGMKMSGASGGGGPDLRLSTQRGEVTLRKSGVTDALPSSGLSKSSKAPERADNQ